MPPSRKPVRFPKIGVRNADAIASSSFPALRVASTSARIVGSTAHACTPLSGPVAWRDGSVEGMESTGKTRAEERGAEMKTAKGQGCTACGSGDETFDVAVGRN